MLMEGAEQLVSALRALLLVVSANAAPWLLARIFGDRWTAPIDFGLRLGDGQRLFGAHKTWRGFFGGVAACSAVAPLVGIAPGIGAAFGALSLVGDTLSSAIKRRLALSPGHDVPLLDQAPEALLPLIVFANVLGLSPASVLFVTLTFAVLDLVATRAWSRARARDAEVEREPNG